MMWSEWLTTVWCHYREQYLTKIGCCTILWTRQIPDNKVSIFLFKVIIGVLSAWFTWTKFISIECIAKVWKPCQLDFLNCFLIKWIGLSNLKLCMNFISINLVAPLLFFCCYLGPDCSISGCSYLNNEENQGSSPKITKHWSVSNRRNNEICFFSVRLFA